MKLSGISSMKFDTNGARDLVSDMTGSVCYAFASAFLQSIAGDRETVVVGHDLRPSSPRIARACLDVIVSSGRRIVYTEKLSAPVIAFYAAKVHAPALVVTGSHISFVRSGIKFYRADGEISKADEQAYKVYVERYLGFFGKGALNGMKVGFYEHSSVARDVLRDILEGLGAQVISLGRTDTFVPIDTEAVRSEDVIQARDWAEEHAFDAIIPTDGDGDRPLIGQIEPKPKVLGRL